MAQTHFKPQYRWDSELGCIVPIDDARPAEEQNGYFTPALSGYSMANIRHEDGKTIADYTDAYTKSIVMTGGPQGGAGLCPTYPSDFWYEEAAPIGPGAWNNLMRQAMSGGPQGGIPSTARAILDLVPGKRTPVLTERQQQQAEGIARALKNLSHYEHRLGASRYQP